MEPIASLIDLSGKVAIITGGGAGIGRGIALRLAEAGASVAIVDTDLERAKATAQKCAAEERDAGVFYADVSLESDVQRMFEEVRARWSRVDVLVNNAGIYPNIPLTEMSVEDFERVLAVNLRGAFLCTKYAAERMIQQGSGGRIINVTSIDALHPSATGLAHYDASKHGLWGFTKNAALELAPHKIWVNALAPGGIDTPGTGAGSRDASDRGGVFAAFLARIPMHRMGEPDDIGRAALFLASNLSSYMTGSQIVVDGGYLLT